MTVLNKNSHLALFCSAYFRTCLFLQRFKNKHLLFTIIEKNRATQNKTKIIKKAGQFKSIILACQHLQSWVFFSKFQLAVLEKRINLASGRGLLRAMEISPGRTQPTNQPTKCEIFTLWVSTYGYYTIYLCINLWLLLVLVEIYVIQAAQQTAGTEFFFSFT